MDLKDSAGGQRSLLILVCLACVIQVALAPQIQILGGRFNAMLALAGAIALTGDTNRAVWAGFLAGLFYDLTAAVPIGLMTLLLTISSFFLASISGAGTAGVSTVSVRMLFAFSIVVSLSNGVGLLVLGQDSGVLISLGSHGLMTGLLSALMGIVFVMFFSHGAVQGRGGFTARGRTGTRFKNGQTGMRLKKRR